MYPGTIFNWHDNSAIQTSPTSNVEDGTPLFMQVFSCDKGTEDLIEIAGTDFDAMYGKMDFFRHGQSAIQAKNIIDHGGKLFAKRVVAENSTLADTVLLAHISAISDGQKAKYADPNNEEYDARFNPNQVPDPETGEMIDNPDYDAELANAKVYIKWDAKELCVEEEVEKIDPETGEPVIDRETGEPVKVKVRTGYKTFEEIKAAAASEYVAEFNPKEDPEYDGLYTSETIIPLIIYAENGRGVSNKAVRLTPDYVTSRTVGKTFYNLSVIEGNTITEKKVISFDPDVVYADVAYRFDKYSTVQICGEVIEDMYQMFDSCSSLESLNVDGFDTSNVLNMDYMFWGCNSLKGIDLSGFNFEKCERMENMFGACSSLEYLDLSGFNAEKIKDISYMFSECRKIKYLDLSRFDMTVLEYKPEYYFLGDCDGLEILKTPKAGYDWMILPHAMYAIGAGI